MQLPIPSDFDAKRALPRLSGCAGGRRRIRSAACAPLWLAVLLFHAPVLAGTDPGTEPAATQAEEILRFQAEQERDRHRQQQLERTRPPAGRWPEEPGVPTPPAGSECVDLRHIRVDGVTLLTASAIDAVVAAYENRCLAVEDLNGVLQQLSFLYVEQGYVTSRAYLPEQDLSDGSLEIVVVEGFLERIVMNGEPGRHAGRIGAAFPRLEGRLLNLRDLEQGLDQLNRLPSNQATIELAAGAELGGSVLQVSTDQGKRWHAAVATDNLGGAFTGQQQTRLALGYDDLLGINDRWSASYQRSMAGHPLDFSGRPPFSDTVTGDLALPYGYWALAVSGTWNQYQSLLAGQIADIKTSGSSTTVRGQLTRGSFLPSCNMEPRNSEGVNQLNVPVSTNTFILVRVVWPSISSRARTLGTTNRSIKSLVRPPDNPSEASRIRLPLS